MHDHVRRGPNKRNTKRGRKETPEANGIEWEMKRRTRSRCAVSSTREMKEMHDGVREKESERE